MQVTIQDPPCDSKINKKPPDPLEIEGLGIFQFDAVSYTAFAQWPVPPSSIFQCQRRVSADDKMQENAGYKMSFYGERDSI